MGPGRAKTAGGEGSSGRGYLRFRLQESGVFQPLWWLNGSRVRAARTSNGGTALEATFSQPGLGLDRCNQRSGPPDVDDAGEIVGEDVERHLGGHAWQPLHQEVGCSHPRLERPERMLD